VRAALDALGAGDDRLGLGEMRGKCGDRLAQILRGRRDQDDVRGCGKRDIVGHLDARVQSRAGQFRVCPCGGDLSRARRAARVKNDVASGPRGDGGKRRPPRAGADHRD